MKKIKEKALIFIALFTMLPPFVIAKNLDSITKTTTYNNYYYFVEPFSTSYQSATKNKGIFAFPKLGYSNENSEIIPLCKRENGSCVTTYTQFYTKLNELNSASNNLITVDGKNCS